ncbi:disulfide bond formation protein B [Sphingomonas ginkgonis]|uniref:Disulfide bond formation protein B n=1 Tax=Sphingomonas ginkgonis TaxID=2315330 RepID=A0A429V7K9_9SPHN|nr:disulfide bond formation protein B [Sphingomonas ginkgonis]RST29933.1 disulfide bond formation protein B [Sphingomonas ginkgonis]
MASAAGLPAARSDRFAPVALGRLLAALIPVALLAGAYGSQLFGGLFPCEMCWWQRYAHFAALPFALGAFLVALGSRTQRVLTLAAALAIGVSGAIGLFHAGVERKWWEGFTTCTATGARSLQDILLSPMIRCDQIQFEFLGISMAGWNAIISLTAALGIAWLTLRPARA